MGTMKLSKYWVAKLVVNAMIITFLLWAIFTVGPQTNVEGYIKDIIYFFYIICIGLIIIFSIFSVIIYNTEGKYYSIETTPIKEFKVDKYKNVVIFALNDYAWVVNAQYKHTINQTEIDVIYRYNRKKQQVNFEPKLPYMMGV